MSVDIKDYRRYRKAGVNLNSKIIDKLFTREMTAASAKFLGIALDSEDGDKCVLNFESNHELDLLNDFLVYDWQEDNKTLIQQYLHQYGADSKAERDLLAAAIKAYSSLFEVILVDADRNVVLLKDLLCPDNPELNLTDIAFSQSMYPGAIVFLRILPLLGFHMSSGAPMAFPPIDITRLDLAQSTDSSVPIQVSHASAKRFQFFFKLQRESGIEVRTTNV